MQLILWLILGAIIIGVLSAAAEIFTIFGKLIPKIINTIKYGFINILGSLGRRNLKESVRTYSQFDLRNKITHRKREIEKFNNLNKELSKQEYPKSYATYTCVAPNIHRQYIKNYRPNIVDLKTILTPNSISAKEKIASALSNLPNFKVIKPAIIQKAQPPKPIKDFDHLSSDPPTLSLPLYKGVFGYLNYFIKKEYSNEIREFEELIDQEKEYDQKVIVAYDLALERYNSLVHEQLTDYENALKIWSDYRDNWESKKENEKEYLFSLLEQFDNQIIERQADLILASIDLPIWHPSEYEIKFDTESGILIVEHEFFDIGSMNWSKSVSLKNGIVDKPLNQKELKDTCEKLYPSISLRIAYELAIQIKGNVEAIAVNGWADYTVKATGNIKRAYCSSLIAKTESLRELNLTSLEPLSAFLNLKGNVARSLELTPIAPSIKINTTDARFVEEKEVLGKLNKEQNLASMNWEDFEHLCRQLFEKAFAASGATVKVTQASRDQGVDAIVFDPDPIRGGKIVIQAKRYVNTVDVSAVRDLYGTVMNEGAMKGILVTTSQYGPEAYSFIQDKPLSLINGNELLSLLEEHGYRFRINLDEARKYLKETNQLNKHSL